jgi:streptogramin lyase
LQLDDTVTPFDFIWVAVSSRGTVVKIDINTGNVLGEYMTSPGQNGNPSRTTVDNNGNVWVANRNNVGPTGKGTVIHIASIPTDQNNDTVITTSTGLGNILPWGTDEAVLHYVEVNSTGTRHLSVDANNDVWVSGTGNRAWDHIDGNTGTLIAGDSYPSVGYGGYGGLIDPNGVIWSARSLLRWDTSLPLSGPIGGNWDGYNHDSYGLGIDSSGNVWNTALSGNTVRKFAPDGTLSGTYAHGNSYAQGVVADQNGDIWVAHSILGGGQSTVGHILNDGTYIGDVFRANGAGPTGVAVDANGFIWATGYYSGDVYRIDPALGVLGADGVTPIGGVDLTISLGGNLYNYSDMTGSTLIAPPNNGTWTVVNNSGIPGAQWTTISWTAGEPGDSSVGVSVASSPDGITFAPLQPVSNGQNMQNIPGIDGQYLKIEVSFTRSTTDSDNDGIKDSSILYDLTVNYNQPPTADPNGPYLGSAGSPIVFNGTGSSDPDGDPLFFNWSWGDGNSDAYAGATPSHTYDGAGIYDVCLNVSDGLLEDTVCTIAVVYDPDAGFVTGGGWIDSPADSYTSDPTLTGRANFGFVSKYQKGKTTPTGQTEFQFQVAGLNFHSSSYDWLVITNHKAMYKGVGTINGAGNYGFMLTAIDAKLTPSTDVDMFRIRIWDKDNGDAIVYDNQLGNAYDADPSTAIAGGSIVIHKK